MAKAKRYEKGGVTEGQNAGIDDDTRARAMKFIQEQSEKSSEDESSGEKTMSRSSRAKVSAKPAVSKAGPTSNAATRDDPDAPEPKVAAETPRMRTRAEIKGAIPTGGKAGAGPTPGDGRSVDSTETSRNLSALMNFTGPGKMATGLTLAAREAKAGKGIQDAYNARAAARRSEEGLSAAEAAAAKAASTAKATRASRESKVAPRREREAKTLNPNAYLAGPKGMMDDFKKGGSVKGWGISRGARKAKNY